MMLRDATAADIPFIMACERGPGYEPFVGRWDETRHLSTLKNEAYRYFVAHDGAGDRGFFILHHSELWPTSLYLKRVAMREADKGHGKRALSVLNDWVFANTETHRFWLEVAENNARARHVYERLGFVVEGIVRETFLEPDGRWSSSVQMSLLRPDWLKMR